VAIACVPAWFFSLAKPRVGFVIAATVMILCLITVSFVGIGK
jgi:hypothetical protein